MMKLNNWLRRHGVAMSVNKKHGTIKPIGVSDILMQSKNNEPIKLYDRPIRIKWLYKLRNILG